MEDAAGRGNPTGEPPIPELCEVHPPAKLVNQSQVAIQ